MSWFSKAFEKTAPIIATFSPEPISRTAAQAKVLYDQQEAQRVARQQAEDRRKAQEMEFFSNSQSSIPTIQSNMQRTAPVVSTASSGGGFLDTVRGGLREVGGFVQDVFSSGVPQLLGFQRPQNIRQQPAITSVTNMGAQESQGSGSIQAGAGALLPSILGGARSLLKSPAGQLALGGGAGIASSLITSDGRKMRITRKMKSQARTVVNIFNGNLSMAADALNISEDMLISVLLKRFRNDGPVVTKAALRKTKSTIRRLHSMQDVLKSITPTSTMRRRAPVRRSTTTLIKN